MDPICPFFVCKESVREFIVRESISGIHLRDLKYRFIDQINYETQYPDVTYP